MPTYPTTRRYFRDDEFRNENAAIAGVVRALALTQNYRYARDLHVTPSDPKVFAEIGWPWNVGAASTPVRSFGTGSGWYSSGHIAELLVTDPRSPATRVEVDVNIDRGSAGAMVGEVSITNTRTGEVVAVQVSHATFTNYWTAGTISASPGDILRVSGRWTSGTNFRVAGLSAKWSGVAMAVPGAVFGAGWSPIAQAFHVANEPASTYTLRWLGRMANAFVYERPLQIASAWLYNPAAGTGAGYSTVPTLVGRYWMTIGGQCPGLTVRIRYRASGACTVVADLNGTAVGIAIPGAGTGVASGTIALTPGTLWAAELTLTVTGAPTYCDVEHVLVYENPSTASSLALGAGTVPADFDPNLDERLGSGRAIRADDLSRLVANEAWLWAYRRDRILVNDCRFTYKETRLDAFAGAAGLADCAAVHEIRTSRWSGAVTAQELRIRAGFHQGAGMGTPTPWEALLFQVGLNVHADSVGAPAVGLGGQYPEGPRVDWASHSRESHQHARGGTVVEGSTYLVETILLTAGHNVTINKMTRPSWLTIEELPFNSPASTYP